MSSKYQQYAASAFAVNSWMRVSFTAAFPMFADQSNSWLCVLTGND